MQILLANPNPFWDPHILSLFDGIKAQLSTGSFVGTAKTLAAIVSIIYLSVRAYSMIIGEGSIQIMQLFRPFVFILIILNFPAFAQIVGSIGGTAQTSIQAKFQANAETCNALMVQKENLMKELTNLIETNKQRLIEERVKSERERRAGTAAAGTDVFGIEESINDFGNAMIQSLVLEAQITWARLSIWIQEMITYIVLALFKGVAYCMFFIQLILMHILLILGPVSFAISIAGPFSHSWIEWTRRYIAVSFYAAITFIVLNIALAIVQYGFEQEISRLTQILQQKDVEEVFLASVTDIGNYLGLLIIALLTTVGGILQIPTGAGWIVGGDGGGGVMFNTAKGISAAGAKGGMNTTKGLAGAATGAVGNVAVGAASVVKGTADTIGKSVNTSAKS